MKTNVKIAVAGIVLVAAVCVINLMAAFFNSGYAVFEPLNSLNNSNDYYGVLFGAITGVFVAILALYHILQAENCRQLMRWLSLPFVVIAVIGAVCFEPAHNYAAMDVLGISLGFASMFIIFSELITREEELETA